MQPESDDDEEDDVLTVVDASLSNSVLERQAAASVGLSRRETRPEIRASTITTSSRTAKKRTATHSSGEQPAKKTTSKC